MRADGFFFNVKQWLGDDAILLMDWDVRAMHFHLMCIAWQQDEPGVLAADENILKKWIGSPTQDDWNKRIKPQIARSWKVADGLWIQEGLRREWARQSNTSEKRRAAAAARWDKGRPGDKSDQADPQSDGVLHSLQNGEPAISEGGEGSEGFNLKSVIKQAASVFEPCSLEERASIWSIGVSLLKHEGFDEGKTRSFLAKAIHENGEKKVAEAIAQLSLKPLMPVDAKSYLMGILKKETVKRKGRGKVAL